MFVMQGSCWLSWSHHFKSFTVATITWLIAMEYLCHIHSWLITGLVTRLTRWVPLVKQELLTPLKYLSLPLVFSGIRITRSLVLCLCFVDRCLSFCTFSFGYFVCLYFFDIQILITPLVSSNSSSNQWSTTLEVSTITPLIRFISRGVHSFS